MAIGVFGYSGSRGGGGGSTPVGATLMQTGQTTSYRTGDDADTRDEGRATDFFTLENAGPFGTNRFTDELGGQTYANNIVIDWSTYDVNLGKVLGYYRVSQSALDWNDAIDSSLSHTVGTFTSGWRLPNKNELNNIANVETARALSYSPFNDSSNSRFWASTTYPFVSTSGFYLMNQSGGSIALLPKSSNYLVFIPCRTFTVTGTTLS